MNTEPVVLERTLNATAERVWKAITDKDQMKEWYFDLAAFKPEPGFAFSFEAKKDGRVFRHLCKITEVIPGKKLTYSWAYEDVGGNSFVSFELFPEGKRTRVRITHTGLETFPADNPDFARHNFVEGWTFILGTGLKAFLEQAV